MGLNNIIGQKKTIQGLEVLLSSNDVMPHILLVGTPGKGKSLISKKVAQAKGGSFIEANGTTIKSESHILPYILRIEYGDILFIDEIHCLSLKAQEVLYTVMEDFRLAIASGMGGENLVQEIPKFTLIGATTDIGNLSHSFIDRFNTFILEEYSKEDIIEILTINKHHNYDIDIEYLAGFSRGVPRRAKKYLEWVIRYCDKHKIKKADTEIINKAMELQGIYNNGINLQDINYMKFLSSLPPNSKAGILTISGATGIDKKTIEKMIEPYLLLNGYVFRTPSGRCLNFQKWKEFVLTNKIKL